MPPRPSRAQAAAHLNFLAQRAYDAARAWKPGDACLAYRGRPEEAERTTVVRVDGDIVHLANGDRMHRSKMRSVP